MSKINFLQLNLPEEVKDYLYLALDAFLEGKEQEMLECLNGLEDNTYFRSEIPFEEKEKVVMKWLDKLEDEREHQISNNPCNTWCPDIKGEFEKVILEYKESLEKRKSNMKPVKK